MKNPIFLFVLALFTFGCETGPNADAVISTEFGDMYVVLYDSTPEHSANFEKLAKENFYDDLLFHRVIEGFMIQGGDPDSRGAAPNRTLGAGGPGYTLPAEIGGIHIKGALSAARLGDQVNPEKRSSGSQFYVVQGKVATDPQLMQTQQMRGITYSEEQKELYKTIGGAPFLDNDYTVFGEVVEGLHVIDSIAAVQTGIGDRPVKDVKMTVKWLK